MGGADCFIFIADVAIGTQLQRFIIIAVCTNTTAEGRGQVPGINFLFARQRLRIFVLQLDSAVDYNSL